MGATWQLPGYQILELVGFGGSGEVWRARDEATGAVVALKRLHSTDVVARERLRREAAILSSVAGEHVVRVRDVVMTATDAVLVMDFAEGGNLATVLAVRGELAGPEVVTLVAPLAMALADAHDRGIIHGDVTPANIVFAARRQAAADRLRRRPRRRHRLGGGRGHRFVRRPGGADGRAREPCRRRLLRCAGSRRRRCHGRAPPRLWSRQWRPALPRTRTTGRPLVSSPATCCGRAPLRRCGWCAPSRSRHPP